MAPIPTEHLQCETAMSIKSLQKTSVENRPFDLGVVDVPLKWLQQKRMDLSFAL